MVTENNEHQVKAPLTMEQLIKELATKEGLNIVENPSSDYVSQPNDFVIINDKNKNVDSIDWQGIIQNNDSKTLKIVKHVAVGLGFNIVENPSADYIKKENDFIIATIKPGLAETADSLRGIPQLDNIRSSIDKIRSKNSVTPTNNKPKNT